MAAPGAADLGSIRLLGVRIHTLGMRALLDHLDVVIEGGRRAFVAYVNVHALNLAVELEDFRRIVGGADVVFCDGNGLRLGAWMAGSRLPHRYSPPDWIEHLCEMCARRGYSLYFVGGRPGVAQQAAERLVHRFPGLRIVGTQHGYFDAAVGTPDNSAVIAAIGRANPNIVLVGLGMPLQERWIHANASELDANVVMTVGAMFDYVAGVTYRAPRWVTDSGFEWLGRLLVEPRRLWRRYLIGNPKFVWRVASWRVRTLLGARAE